MVMSLSTLKFFLWTIDMLAFKDHVKESLPLSLSSSLLDASLSDDIESVIVVRYNADMSWSEKFSSTSISESSKSELNKIALISYCAKPFFLKAIAEKK